MRNSIRWLQSSFLAVLCAAALAAPAAHADPVLTGFNNDRGPLLSRATLYGSGFGDAQGSSYVLFGGRGVPILAWSDGAISILVNPMAYSPQPLPLDTAYPV
jgi:hypothetical protein